MQDEDKTQEKIGTEWWEEKINRRQANKKVAQIVAGGALVATMGAGIWLAASSDSDDDDDEVQFDSNELQKKNGWNVGSTDKHLAFPDQFVVTKDSLYSDKWREYVQADKLIEAYRPDGSPFLPYSAPTLAQALSEPSLKDEMKLYFSPEMARAYSRGLGVKALIEENKNNDKIIMFADIPGAEAIAFGAAIADVANLITTFDNYPHPIGVVPSHFTLSAMIYYAAEIAEKKKSTDKKLINVFLCDSNRFKEQINEDAEFDNRYMVKIPTIEDLKKNSIENVLYCTQNRTNEVDDLNDDFVEYTKAGINIKLIDLKDFQPEGQNGAPGTDSLSNQPAGAIQTRYQSAPPVYYYGGSHSFIPMFFYYHAFMSYSRPMPRMTSFGGSTLRPSSYAPAARQTIFSSRAVGGAGGIGRTRPSGFGRVTTRVSSRTGGITGFRPGRSGSFGRVGGRGG